MKIGEYVKEYTSGEEIKFKEVVSEIKELLAEISKFNREGMKEELEDVLHFLQLWFFWRFGINEEIWEITENSVKKFIERKKIWNKIYVYVGLKENVSGYVGNYRKIDKVVNHLQKFGINREKAEESYNKIVLGI